MNMKTRHNKVEIMKFLLTSGKNTNKSIVFLNVANPMQTRYHNCFPLQSHFYWSVPFGNTTVGLHEPTRLISLGSLSWSVLSYLQNLTCAILRYLVCHVESHYRRWTKVLVTFLMYLHIWLWKRRAGS